ncbi:MAG: hypothetical protein IJE05_01690 [Clostridia bacterium]|nr:hypothetical protein [Clostridia bacterium]
MAAKPNMEARIDKIEALIENKFHGNNTYFAKEMGMGREYVSAILNERINADSPKFCNALIAYCERNNLDYREYVRII